MFTKFCAATAIANGVLMNDGKPAGKDLLDQATLKVALVDTVNADQASFLASDIASSAYKYNLDMISSFPEGFKELVPDALKVWKDYEITFVNPDQKPDLFIYAVFNTAPTTAGEASFPQNDHPTGKKFIIGNDPAHKIIFMNVHSPIFEQWSREINKGSKGREYRTPEEMASTLTHEFGHSLGIFHPENAVGFTPFEICPLEEARSLHDLFGSRSHDKGGIMSTNPVDPDNPLGPYEKNVLNYMRGMELEF